MGFSNRAQKQQPNPAEGVLACAHEHTCTHSDGVLAVSAELCAPVREVSCCPVKSL